MRILLSLALLSTLVLSTPVHAQEEPTPTEQESVLDETLQNLKDKIENKVEEINEETKSVIHGVIEKLEDGVIEVKSASAQIFTVSLDDTITSFYQTSISGAEEIEQDDIDEGDYVIISGPIIEDQVSANVLFVQTRYIVAQGQITATNKSNFTIDVVTQERDEYTLDIEDSTDQAIYDTKSGELESAGFSSYKVGDNIHFVIEDPEDETQASAIRTLIIPQEFFVDETPTEGDTPTDEEATESES